MPAQTTFEILTLTLPADRETAFPFDLKLTIPMPDCRPQIHLHPLITGIPDSYISYTQRTLALESIRCLEL